jgi:hypothetical protein
MDTGEKAYSNPLFEETELGNRSLKNKGTRTNVKCPISLQNP